MKNPSKKVMDMQFTGPDTHVSVDQTVNPLAIPTSRPTGNASEYPKYLYHKQNGPKLVHSSDEHAELGDGYAEAPHAEEDESTPSVHAVATDGHQLPDGPIEDGYTHVYEEEKGQ